MFDLQSGRRASVFDMVKFDPKTDDFLWRQQRPVDQRAFVIDLPCCIFFMFHLMQPAVSAQCSHTICANLEKLHVHVRDLSAGVVGRTSRNFRRILSS